MARALAKREIEAYERRELIVRSLVPGRWYAASELWGLVRLEQEVAFRECSALHKLGVLKRAMQTRHMRLGIMGMRERATRVFALAEGGRATWEAYAAEFRRKR
jgi:hypothetical protein